jgi:hypothetical protein
MCFFLFIIKLTGARAEYPVTILGAFSICTNGHFTLNKVVW